MADFIGENIQSLPPAVIKILLSDKTTKRNIIWATDNYAERGYLATDEIQLKQISGFTNGVIKSRVSKATEEQARRTRVKAEVFTPSWICNKMNNHCDEVWFGKKNVFNIEDGQKWRLNPNKVKFPEGRSWQEYIDSRRIEITCGEAPYIVSRYDTTTGEAISLKRRIGILDRKLRIVNENAEDDNTWLKWTTRAFQSVYGYEFQGDNLFIARINAIMTYIEYYENRFNEKPNEKKLKEIANIIAWNFWQMDGITNTIPFGAPKVQEEQLDMFAVIANPEEKTIKETPVCKIYDWRKDNSLLFTSLKKRN